MTSEGSSSKQRLLTQLREVLTERFNEGELRTLCFDLNNIDYDSLLGEEKASKARELVAYFDRYNRIPELKAAISRARSDISWEDSIQVTTSSPPQNKSGEQSEPVFQIQFENQQTELDIIAQQLTDPGHQPYVYISAPAQMGKTFILEELRKRYDGRGCSSPGEAESSDLRKWRCIYVDLEEGPNRWDQPEFLIATIIRKLGDVPGSTAQDLARSLNRLRSKSERALILMDNVERLTDHTAEFLLQLLKDLEIRIGDLAYLPGLVVAGRRAFQVWERNYRPAMRRVELSPFTETVVHGLLKKATEAKKLTYPFEWYRDRATEIVRCSAGHPGCIAALVQHFYSGDFTLTDLNDDRVFKRVVVPIIENKILTEHNLAGSHVNESFDFDRMARVLTELSTYRLITPGHIELVIRHLGLNLLSGEVDALEKDIKECLLIEEDRENGWQRIGNSVRRLLERNLTLQRRDAMTRHRKAAENYDNWLSNLEDSIARIPLSGGIQAAYIREALFHHTRGYSGSEQERMDYLTDKVKQYGNVLRPAYPGQPVRRILANLMARDEELYDIIETLANRDFYTKLLTLIENP
jgi:hypothetical protein